MIEEQCHKILDFIHFCFYLSLVLKHLLDISTTKSKVMLFWCCMVKHSYWLFEEGTVPKYSVRKWAIKQNIVQVLEHSVMFTSNSGKHNWS